MISIEELKRIEKIKGIYGLGNVEKDYLIELILFSISKNTKDELVFKGGTCLSKFYKLERFSEDIDFTLMKDLDINLLIKRIVLDLGAFGIEAEVKKNKKVFDSTMITLRTKGPLYNGLANSLSNVRIDINVKSSISLHPINKDLNSLYSELPRFSLDVMQEEEILAEKTRAVINRVKARDVYDIWFILQQGININLKVVEEKLEYYKQRWNLEKFREKIEEKNKIWHTEMKSLVKIVPDFKKVRDDIIGDFEKA